MSENQTTTGALCVGPYLGYTGSCKVDFKRGILHGKILNIKESVTYEAETPSALKQEFKMAVDDYLTKQENKQKQEDSEDNGLMPFVGYYAEVTEHEWGLRPDGYLITLTKEAGEAVATKDRGYLCRFDQGFCEAGDFKLCVLTEHAMKALQGISNKTMWVEDRDFNLWVKQV